MPLRVLKIASKTRGPYHMTTSPNEMLIRFYGQMRGSVILRYLETIYSGQQTDSLLVARGMQFLTAPLIAKMISVGIFSPPKRILEIAT